MSYNLEVSHEYSGVKVKNYLKKHLDISYGALSKHLKNKRITLNKKKIKSEDILREGDIITIWLDSIELRKKSTKNVEKKDLGMKIIYSTEDFFVLNKKSGVIVQGAQDNSLSLSLHLAYLKNKWEDNSDFDYFHVHRLDKETTGALVIAKNRVALRELNALFRQRDVVKKYLCVCDGVFEEKSGSIELYLYRNPDGSLEKVGFSNESVSQGKRTISKYRVIKEFSKGDDEFSLVEIEIETGFMHQIRVHMKALKHPVVGDKMYGNSYINDKYELERQLLHASILLFEYKGENHEIEVQLSDDISQFIQN